MQYINVCRCLTQCSRMKENRRETMLFLHLLLFSPIHLNEERFARLKCGKHHYLCYYFLKGVYIIFFPHVVVFGLVKSCFRVYEVVERNKHTSVSDVGY